METFLVPGTNQHSVQWIRNFFNTVKRLENEVNNSFPPTAKVKNEWSYKPVHHIRLHGVEKKQLQLYPY